MSTCIYDLTHLITVELLLFNGDDCSLLSCVTLAEGLPTKATNIFLPNFFSTQTYYTMFKMYWNYPDYTTEKICSVPKNQKNFGIRRTLTSTTKNDSTVGCIINGLRGYAATRWWWIWHTPSKSDDNKTRQSLSWISTEKCNSGRSRNICWKDLEMNIWRMGKNWKAWRSIVTGLWPRRGSRHRSRLS